MPKRKKNNKHDFSNKEVYLLLLDNINNKLDKHLEWAEKICDKYLPMFNKLQEGFNDIYKQLPDKGFCLKIDKIYQDIYPEGTEEPNLPQKVNLLWNDRRWLKGILYFLITLGIGNVLIALMKF